MKKGTIDARYTFREGHEITEKTRTIPALISGNFALHNAINYDGTEYKAYRITHIKSGLQLPVKELTYKQAREFVTRLDELPCDWTLPTDQLTAATHGDLAYALYQEVKNPHTNQ